MASEKDNFKKAIGYIKYELESANAKERKVLEKELDFWISKWSYKPEQLESIKPATEASIRSDFEKDKLCPKYSRTAKVSKLLNNDFDKLINQQEKSLDLEFNKSDDVKPAKTKASKPAEQLDDSQKSGIISKFFNFLKK